MVEQEDVDAVTPQSEPTPEALEQRFRAWQVKNEEDFSRSVGWFVLGLLFGAVLLAFFVAAWR